MFVSFFPRPRLFFWSAAIWAVLTVAGWYVLTVAFPATLNPSETIIGASSFWSPPFLWFYAYCAVMIAIFAIAWMTFSPHPWATWSLLGTAYIVFATYFQVQITVAVNNWYRPFYDLIQAALTQPGTVTALQLYESLAIFAGIALVSVMVRVVTVFFVNHYVFRWRTAMNDYYVSNWSALRSIEGAAQRVQEDTMRFARIVETLGVNFIDAVMTLFAFLPILLVLSAHVTELPLLGTIPYPLVIIALGWSLFGTFLLGLVGIKLPGLEFRNQRVEAAYRKELVFGEDHADRAEPMTLSELFGGVRGAYFRYYFHYMYFNIARFSYLQTDNVFPYIVLAPTIAAGKITLGIMQQILSAFGEVRTSFQYLVNSWPTIVELISIYKRLRAFEATLYGEPLSEIEREVPPAPQEAPA